MFILEMKVGRKWENVGDFENFEEAKGCMFNKIKDYRILDQGGSVIFSRKKLAKSYRDLI